MVLTNDEKVLIFNFMQKTYPNSNPGALVDFVVKLFAASQAEKDALIADIVAYMNTKVSAIDTSILNLDADKTAKENTLNAEKTAINGLITKLNAL